MDGWTGLTPCTLCSDTGFVYTGHILGLEQQTLADTQIWKERLAKELWENGAEDAITQAVRNIVSVNYMILVFFSGDKGKRINDSTYSYSGTYFFHFLLIQWLVCYLPYKIYENLYFPLACCHVD